MSFDHIFAYKKPWAKHMCVHFIIVLLQMKTNHMLVIAFG